MAYDIKSKSHLGSLVKTFGVSQDAVFAFVKRFLMHQVSLMFVTAQ